MYTHTLQHRRYMVKPQKISVSLKEGSTGERGYAASFFILTCIAFLHLAQKYLRIGKKNETHFIKMLLCI